MSMRKHNYLDLPLSNSRGEGFFSYGKYLLLFLCMLTLAVSAAAVHTSTANLSPEWTAAGQPMNYTVTITNNGPNAVDEVRIYRNTGYYPFECDEKDGWEMNFITSKQACHYIAETSGAHITSGNFETFTFSATAPNEGCELTWKFETRDITDTWYLVTDTTSVDDKDPTIEKTVTGSQSGPCPPSSGEECWITQSTTIGIDVTEQGDCGISGLDYCEVTYTLDGGSSIQKVYAELNGENSWNYSMSFGEDSVHVLTVECADIAGNIITDVETFRVDDTPPVSSKKFIGTQKIILDPTGGEGYIEWIDGITTVELTAVDPDPTTHSCNIGVEETYYKNILASDLPGDLSTDPEVPCLNPSTCQSLKTIGDNAPGDWLPYPGTPITKDEESCHILWYYSVDKLGNEEDVQVNCFFVDKTPPIAIKEVGEPKVPMCDERDITQSWDIYNVKEANTGDIYNVEDYPLTFNGPLNVEAITHLGGTVEFKADVPAAFVDGSQDNLAFTFDSDNDGEADFQLSYHADISSHYNGAYWGYREVAGGAWSGWLEVPVDYTTNETGNKVFSITFSSDLLGGCGADYKFGVAGSYAGTGTQGQINPGANIHFQFPEDFSWGANWVGSEDYYLNYVGAQKDWWVQDHVTEITLDCEDQLPHPSGDEGVCYKVSFDDPQMPWLTLQYCTLYGGTMEGDWCCANVEGDNIYTIKFVEDSRHDLEYFCRDAVDKESEIDVEYFKVDSQAPIITKTMLGSYLDNDSCPPGPGKTGDCYVADNSSSGVRIDVTDDETYGCAVNLVECSYELWWDGGIVDEGSFTDYKEIYFQYDSTHTLKIRCADALGNQVYDEEEFLVDSTPPVTTKTYGTPTKVVGNERWITSDTEITLTAVDNKVGVDYIKYRYCLDPDCYDTYSCAGCNCGEKTWETVYGNKVVFKIPEDSEHCIEYYAVDKFGYQEETKSQCVYVDNMPPASQKTVGDPKVVGDGGTFDWWVTQNTPITLDCIDPTPHPVNQETLCYRVSLDDYGMQYLTGSYCSAFGGQMNEDYCCVYVGESPLVMHFLEESNHNLEYYCKDHLGNTEETVHVQWYKVDTTPPTVEKIVNEPYYGDCPARPKTGDVCFVDTATTIDLELEDGGDICAVGGVECRWRYTIGGGPTGFQSDWNSELPIMFPEECEHVLTIECKDALENTWTDIEVFLVDKTPPETSKWYGQPAYPAEGYPKWITSNTPVYLKADDAGPHKSGIKEINWRVSLVGDEYCNDQQLCQGGAGIDKAYDKATPGLMGGEEYDATFKIGEESCHMIEYYSVDNVDKTEAVKRQCVFVDNTPPTPEKTVGEPKTPWDGKDSIFYDIDVFCETPENCWKVTLLTPVELACEDQTPHPVGNETVCFYVELDGDDATEAYCTEKGGNYNENGDDFCCMEREFREFYFHEETEHNLQYYCVDALGNKGPIDDEKFKVEGTAFEIQLNKKWNLISVPFVLIDSDITNVLKDVKEDVESVWSYDAFTGGWSVYRPSNPDTSDLETIEPGKGYWLAAYDSNTLTIGGSLFSPTITPPDVPIKHGWNLIGYYGVNDMYGNAILSYNGPVEAGKQASCALWSLGESYLDKGWTSLLTYWELNNPNQWKEYNYYQRMDPGAGYWLNASEDSIYSYVTTCGGIY